MKWTKAGFYSRDFQVTSFLDHYFTILGAFHAFVDRNWEGLSLSTMFMLRTNVEMMALLCIYAFDRRLKPPLTLLLVVLSHATSLSVWSHFQVAEINTCEARSARETKREWLEVCEGSLSEEA